MQCEVSRELANCPSFLRKLGECGARQLFYTLSYLLPSCTHGGTQGVHLCSLEVLRLAETVMFEVKNS